MTEHMRIAIVRFSLHEHWFLSSIANTFDPLVGRRLESKRKYTMKL